jgi:saccharopine dehydrogenase (NADP+, L-glutamate forming)
MNFIKNILLFGAGKSATVLIDYLKKKSAEKNWLLTVADNNLEVVQSKLGNHPNTHAIQINIENAIQRKQLVSKADIVISMMPPLLHYPIAMDCIEFSKDLLTASYTDIKIQALSNEINERGLLFLCEMGLDPGIDHMSAMQLIHGIKSKNGIIRSFKSHCGGLVAPENDDNPWHYKISWNPRNVVLAGKSGAVFKMNGQVIEIPYTEIFNSKEQVSIPGLSALSFYPNRDSISYIDLYELRDIPTFIRTTLRYPSFLNGWKKVVDCLCTDEKEIYKTEGMSIAHFFDHQFKKSGIAELSDPIILEMFLFLGMMDHQTKLPMSKGSAADILQFVLENKLALKPGEKDMVVMLHEIEYSIGEKTHRVESSLVTFGVDDQRTAMAKTVGLPLGIAAVLILEGKIKEKGLHIPIKASIYEPVLMELAKESIQFTEKHFSL